ncbi:hypothetical protein TNIN_474441 [Trichonephila inaurata madagascariensis]|uniref:Uncharacterized protein n=1 Tax=Trichonephila inaurata madagascariensis TaxID=2747483 RepID=A0A8X7C9D6_9ARAC|nr:hypothetical protein TNIN_474441 [Trichonephila inaurata madagascariensis]
MKKSIPSIHQKKMSPPKQPPQKSKPHFQRGDKDKKQKPLKLYAMGVTRHVSLALSAFLEIEKTRKFTVLSAVLFFNQRLVLKTVDDLRSDYQWSHGHCLRRHCNNLIAGETFNHIMNK